MMAWARPPIESPEPMVKFAALRLFLAVSAVVALIATKFPFGGGLTAVVAAAGLPWAIGNVMLAQRQPELALSPLVAAGDLLVLAGAEIAAPAAYGPVRFLALLFIAAHAQFQGQAGGLLVASGGCALLIPMAAWRGAPVHGDMLALYETAFAVCALSAAVTAGNIRIAETVGRLRARQVSRRMIETEGEIRRRVAESIHDGPVQELVSLDMILSAVSTALEKGAGGDSTRQMLAEAHSIAERNIQALRDEIVSLGPSAFRELSFETAVTDCVPVWRRRFGLDVQLDLEPVNLAPEVSGPLFQIAQEAVTNAGRHAQAQRVTVGLREQDGQVVLRVADDGRGFGDFWPLTQDEAGHIGLSSMRERAEMLGGRLTIDSSGRGTVVTVRLPTESARA